MRNSGRSLSHFRQNATATHFERELAGARPTNAMAEGCQNSDSRFERRLVELSPSTLGSGSSRLRRLASHPLYSTGFISMVDARARVSETAGRRAAEPRTRAARPTRCLWQWRESHPRPSARVAAGIWDGRHRTRTGTAGQAVISPFLRAYLPCTILAEGSPPTIRAARWLAPCS